MTNDTNTHPTPTPVEEVIETRNAKILRTLLGPEDHGIFTAMIGLDYGGVTQALIGGAFDEPIKVEGQPTWRRGCAYGAEFVRCVLATLEVANWESLPNTVCRVRCTQRRVIEIGHIIKDQWFNPSTLSGQFTAERVGSYTHTLNVLSRAKAAIDRAALRKAGSVEKEVSRALATEIERLTKLIV